MGNDYSYDCIAVQNVRLLDTFGDKQILLADVQFEDEHEHPLALLIDVLVVLEDGAADLEGYPENFLPEDADEATFERYHKLCKNYPGYHAHSPEAFGDMVLAVLPTPGGPLSFPTVHEFPGLVLTLTGVVYAHRAEFKHRPVGESTLVFAAVDGEGRTGHVEWQYEWDKRDITLDALATDQPAWKDALGDDGSFEFPSAYYDARDYAKPGTDRDAARPDCTIACQRGR